MVEVVSLSARRPERRRQTQAAMPIQSGHFRGTVRVFPGPRQLRMIECIAAHMATLGELQAREFLVFHFEVVELSRLIDQGISDAEIDSYIFTTARAIWARVRRIQAGAA
ncbi:MULTISPECIES: hypothetical protein [unclassified Bradyrhizobium]|uniref:hypothetical protein n=1 Tax=unclassified Bradyrhizobium TaxID=2631580 RepID=UPI0028E900FD|nr:MULTISPECIES: hypothetical protein [unclassified Bradyrhizobium]